MLLFKTFALFFYFVLPFRVIFFERERDKHKGKSTPLSFFCFEISTRALTRTRAEEKETLVPPLSVVVVLLFKLARVNKRWI